MTDSPSIFDETVTDIVTNKIRYCTIKAGTGAGKTTTLPCKICKYGDGKLKVICVLPTREAVYNAYERVSTNKVHNVNVTFKCGSAANSIVNYKNKKISLIRHVLYDDLLDESEDEDHQLVFCTTGHFKRILRDSLKYLNDDSSVRPRSLGFFDYVMIDEAHLKSMDIDLIIRYLKYMLVSYPTKAVPNVICTSATYNEPKLYDLMSKGMYNVKIMYVDTGASSIDGIIDGIPEGLYNILINLKTQPSKVLIFLPGIKEIRRLNSSFHELDIYDKLEIVIAHSSRTREQMRDEVFTQNTPGKWKIILATNIAETSLTIPGVKIVVDPCIEVIREMGSNKTVFDKRQFISQDSADQRAGRVGRIEDGLVFRMLSPEAYARLPRSKNPEIDRLPISYEVLQAIDCNVDIRFIFGDINSGIRMSISEQQSVRLNRTLKELKSLGCITECSSYYTLTSLGRFISNLSVTVKSGYLMYSAIKDGVDPYPIIVATCMIENAERMFNSRIHPEFISDVPLATLINPWLKMCALFGTIKVPNSRLTKYCSDYGLNYEVFIDVHRKIMDCINKFHKAGCNINVYMFDTENIFIIMRNYFVKICYKYEKQIREDKSAIYVSANKEIKLTRPLFLDNKFYKTNTQPELIFSVLNVDMSGRNVILVWYPDGYLSKREREIESMIQITRTEFVAEEDDIDEDKPYVE